MAALGGLSLSWSDLADLLRLRNQTGSLLLLLPTLWALVLAGDGHPPLSLTAIFVAGVFVMRSAGVTVNDLWDRDLDRRGTGPRGSAPSARPPPARTGGGPLFLHLWGRPSP